MSHAYIPYFNLPFFKFSFWEKCVAKRRREDKLHCGWIKILTRLRENNHSRMLSLRNGFKPRHIVELVI